MKTYGYTCICAMVANQFYDSQLESLCSCIHKYLLTAAVIYICVIET